MRGTAAFKDGKGANMAAITDEQARDKIIVALDCSRERALELADMLQGSARWLKVGMTLYYTEGPAIVAELKERGFKIFLDLKLHDIPHQIRGAAQSIAATGADMLTIHACGGAEMAKAAVEGAAAGAPGELPAILAVTVLTSMDDKALRTVGVSSDAQTQVKRLAALASASGVRGVVASPLEAAMLRELLGPDALIVTPGVRPAGSAAGDQARVATPLAAISAGASHVVIGRPITQATDPAAAFEAIVEEIIAG